MLAPLLLVEEHSFDTHIKDSAGYTVRVELETQTLICGENGLSPSFLFV